MNINCVHSHGLAASGLINIHDPFTIVGFSRRNGGGTSGGWKVVNSLARGEVICKSEFITVALNKKASSQKHRRERSEATVATDPLCFI